MAKQSKLTKKQLIITITLSVLLIAAIFIAIVATGNKDDTPTFSEQTTDSSDTTKAEVTDNQDTTLESETKAPEVPVVPTKFYNPLTGAECTEELSQKRPVAIMINNIKESLPQHGISNADILYECLAEGGITRLLMLVQDYKSLGVVGSIRSSRDYYLDFAQNHDALYFHAGGSDKAYSEIASRNIDNFDGVRMTIPNSFYRDTWRLSLFAYEHTLVITGEGIQNAIDFRQKRTELKEEFESPFKFNTETKAPEGEDANCVYLPFSWYQSPYLKYDNTTNTYKRWQYNEKHIDKENGKQLEFTNIIVIFCHHTGALDDKGRIEVTTTGSGEGYYISNGKYIDIKYTKDSVDSAIKLFNADGSPLEINSGKTYIAIFNSANKAEINMNYNK